MNGSNKNLIDFSLLQQMAEKIREKFDAKKIILFGSHAYGNPDSSSDIDLLIIMETQKSFPRVAAEIRLYLDDIFGVICPMDILVRTPQEIERRIREGDFFLNTVLSKGKEL